MGTPGDDAPRPRFLREVSDRLGMLPNFFFSAQSAPGVVEEQWRFAKSAYLDSPLPSLFKERLFAHLSRFCEVRYCVIRHVGFLIGRGRPAGDPAAPVQTIDEVIALLARPLPNSRSLAAAFARLTEGGVQASLPEPASQGEGDLFDALTVIFLEPAHSEGARAAVRAALGDRRFEILAAFLAFIRTAHYWTESHPELAVESDMVEVMDERPDLAALLLDRSDAERVKTRRDLRAVLAELQQSEAALRESERRFRALMTTGGAYLIYRMSPDWREMRALDGRGVLSDTVEPNVEWLDEYIDAADRPEVLAAIGDAIRRKGLFELEHRVRLADGALGWVLSRAVPILDEAGEITEWFGAATDVTARHEVEDRLRGSEVELRSLNETLESRVADEVAARLGAEDALRQAQKMEAIGQLTGGVAHDFNNLLTVIRSSADLLRREDLGAERRRRYVDAISETADRAAKLTGQLLAFSRRQTLEPQVFEVAERVHGVADMLRTVVGARVELSVEVRSCPCFVEADVAQFETALVNLAVNARDAMEGEGRLSIWIDDVPSLPPRRGHAAQDGPFIAVSVSDTGSGIAPDILPRVFEPFFTTKDVGQGTGLGLSQVYGFAKQSGGDVDVISKPGEGALFKLYLPRTEAPAETVAPREAAEATGPRRGRVLVVEDNSQIGEFATQLLGDLGYETELAANAREALMVLEREAGRIDVVFSDVVMPGMSGVELARRIRERWPGLPIVLTSGYSHALVDDARHGFDLLRKPYSVEELSRVLDTGRLRSSAMGRRRPALRSKRGI